MDSPNSLHINTLNSGVAFDNASRETGYATLSPMGGTSPSLTSLLSCPKTAVSGLLRTIKTSGFNPPKNIGCVTDDSYLGMPLVHMPMHVSPPKTHKPIYSVIGTKE